MPIMGEAISIRIKNASQIRRAYDKAPAEMTKALSIAIKKAAFLVQGRSMQNAPVLTGRLRASHFTHFMPLAATVGTNTNYDTFVHEGTKFMKGRPYLRMAVEDSNNEINDLFTRATQEVLNELGRRSS
jgi:phage gpG-like protein